jgi:hypothetical protein
MLRESSGRNGQGYPVEQPQVRVGSAQYGRQSILFSLGQDKSQISCAQQAANEQSVQHASPESVIGLNHAVRLNDVWLSSDASYYHRNNGD